MPGGLIQRVLTDPFRTEFLTLDAPETQWVDAAESTARTRAMFFERYSDADALADKLREQLGYRAIYAVVAVKPMPHRPVVDPIGETVSSGVAGRAAEDEKRLITASAQPPARKTPKRKKRKADGLPAAHTRETGVDLTNKFWWRENQYA